MKAVLSTMMLVVGFVSFASAVQAQDTNGGNESKSAAQVAQTKENFWPRGGWDGNNLRISVSHSKLLGSAQK